jgi:hypothetical protein
VGDDANPCSRTAPCKTFAGTISKTAAGGEINVLDPGGFGALTITKAITIDATGVEAGVLVSGTNGIVVAAGATDAVFLRGLDFVGINGLSGIDFVSGLMLTVENCRISGFTEAGISIASSTAGTQVYISHTLVHDQSNSGIVISPPFGVTTSVVLDHVQVINSAQSGLSLNGGSYVYVRDSEFAHNGASGVTATGAAFLFFDSNDVSGNGVGLTLASGASARLSRNNVTGNAIGFNTSGGVLHSFGNNETSGNADGARPTVTLLSQL